MASASSAAPTRRSPPSLQALSHTSSCVSTIISLLSSGSVHGWHTFMRDCMDPCIALPDYSVNLPISQGMWLSDAHD